MKTIKLALLFFVSIFGFNTSQAQQVQQLDVTTEMSLSNLRGRMVNSPVEAQGSPYINDSFMPVRIQLGDEAKIYIGRYNAYKGDMEIKVDGKAKPIALDITKQDYTIIFVNTKVTYKVYNYLNDKNNSQRGFLVDVKINDNASLLRKESIKFVQATAAQSSYQKDTPAQFKRLKDAYYIKYKDNAIVEMPKKKKEIAAMFPEKSKEILKFIKSEKIKTSKEKDLIKLVDYINSI